MKVIYDKSRQFQSLPHNEKTCRKCGQDFKQGKSGFVFCEPCLNVASELSKATEKVAGRKSATLVYSNFLAKKNSFVNAGLRSQVS